MAKPKSTCCDDRPRCKRCPIRLLAEGRLSPADARQIFAKARNRKVLQKQPKGKKKLSKVMEAA